MADRGRLFESIRLVDGKAQLLDYHEERIGRSLGLKYQFGQVSLNNYIEDTLRERLETMSGVYKFRFEYDGYGRYSPTLTPYNQRLVSRLIPCEIINPKCYEYKWTDRSCLTVSDELRLAKGFSSGDEVVFVYDGLLTDTTYSNIILDMGDGRWLSPRTPLLRGVMRQYLLDEGVIEEADLEVSHLEQCRRFRLINALLPLME